MIDVIAALTGLCKVRAERRYRYRTLLGHAFEFDLVKQPDGQVRVYIANGPYYGCCPTDGHSTHRFYDYDRDLHYVCIRDDLVPTNSKDAKNWARYWADHTSMYIVHGKEFS